MSAIPTLETPRLRLRPHRLEDFEFTAAMWADADVVRHIGDGKLLSRADAWLKFQRFPGHWHWTDYGSWAIEEKATLRPIGEVGFIDRRLLREEEFAGIPEVGWSLARAQFGKGYGTEAVARALEWGREHFGPVRVLAVINPENIASIRVAEKCGFREHKRGVSAGRERIFFDRVL